MERSDHISSASRAEDQPDDSLVLARLFAERHSCRGYLPRPVPRATIEHMLSIAQRSASWCNSQPWQTIVTTGRGTDRFRDALFAQAQADMLATGAPALHPDLPFPTAYRGIYKDRQREVGWQLYESVGVKHGDREGSGKQSLENFRLFDAPHALIITSERDLGTYGAIDCGLYVGSLLLAAQSLGLGMIPQAALAAYAPLIRQHFGIADNRIVVLGASFGYADKRHPANSFRTNRETIATAVTWVEQ